MAKITPRMEKRQKWLEDKKNLSRVTRARTAQQSSSSSQKSVSSQSQIATPKSKHSSPSQTNKTKSGKISSSQSSAKHSDIKIGASSNQSTKKSKYGNNGEMSNDIPDNGSKEKPASKKLKVQYVDAVEKLESSSSIHVPKKLVLFVGNLPEDITKEQVMAHFRRTGGVKSVKLPKYRGTETGKGFAYIEFNSTISHRIALRLNNTTLADRKIIVEFTSGGKMTEKQLHEKLKQNHDRHLNMPFDT